MLISIENLKKDYPEFENSSDGFLKRKLNAIEHTICLYTHNDFTNRKIKFVCESDNEKLIVSNSYLKIGDTVKIFNSINEGLYSITKIENGYIYLDRQLFKVPFNTVIKVQYPDDVIDGAIGLLKWNIGHEGKVGIKQETISRHSVTYYDQDKNNQIEGYPVSLIAFLKKYRKAQR